MKLRQFTVTLEGGAAVPAVRVARGADLSGLRGALALPPCRGTVAVVGGAQGLSAPEYEEVRRMLRRLLAELAELAIASRLTVVDGGTAFGIMKLLGEARALQSDDFPLIGVAPLGRVTWADRPPAEGGEAPLDANHGAFVLVESDEWGGEAETLAEAAHTLAEGQPSIEILINGGEIAPHDAAAYLRLGGRLVVVEGSGRFADELISVMKGHPSDSPIIQEILATGRVFPFSLDSAPGTFKHYLKNLAGW
jgi:hypothetical protein